MKNKIFSFSSVIILAVLLLLNLHCDGVKIVGGKLIISGVDKDCIGVSLEVKINGGKPFNFNLDKENSTLVLSEEFLKIIKAEEEMTIEIKYVSGGNERCRLFGKTLTFKGKLDKKDDEKDANGNIVKVYSVPLVKFN